MTRCPLCGKETKTFRDKETEPAFCPVCLFPLRANVAIPLGDSNLLKYIEISRHRMVILFWAAYDTNSMTFLELFDDTAAVMESTTVLVKMDVAMNPEMKRNFSIQMLPTLVVTEHGREINRVLGSLTRFELERLIETGGV